MVNKVLVVYWQEETTPYSFYVNDTEITESLAKTLDKDLLESSESVLEIVYQPQAVFRVRAVTRCTSTIEGHAEAVISVQFSPNGQLVQFVSSLLCLRCAVMSI